VLPPARSAVPQVSLERVKFVESSIVGAEHPVAVAPPEFVNVNAWFVEAPPTETFPKSWVSGVHARTGSTPVTRIWFAVVEAVPPKVQVRERVAVRAAAEVGCALMTTVQVVELPAKVFVPQLSVVISNSVGFVPPRDGAEHPVAVAVPELVRVNVWVEESVSTAMFP
jgi:hypothetical protein